ncbi:ABC transporter, ATP-binding protein [Bifidobacterium actinocoloniiforme DSM 22766]|uniref:ABC transporter, ATP-binding protein n=2 Tax=Bifidobacterium actinocoloniiforme TaxID=638619 RepID=A0A086Z1E6_9BIFI|nr:methionine ABC transporter ATP-binding protein [Bifidobacterium actinocoloniiforme DSM 22766]KFI40346.1 ABC transporter, ATP-binding protein [Bifidobacterium actinocoloniiforme DSM 22766]
MQEGRAVIALSHLSKTYHSEEEGDRTALSDVSLRIDKGDIFGIIGLSGAGKSTLVRCLNGLETYQGGSVKVRGQEVADLSPRELRSLRQRTGMIFQRFNLMPSRTLLGNVALPLANSGLNRKERTDRARELLELVGLAELGESYPAELSGGQQQRVAIARALANRPDILLSDEATSALDPNTTKSILALLRRLHDELGITVVMITHEMAVVRQICNRLAVIDQGRIVEEGRVFDVFANPQAWLTKSFVATTSNLDKVGDLIEAGSPLIQLKPGQVLLRMRFTAKTVDEAMVSTISRRFDLDVNIIFGDVDVVEGSQLGGLVVRLEGSGEHIRAALEYMRSNEIGIEVLDRG